MEVRLAWPFPAGSGAPGHGSPLPRRSISREDIMRLVSGLSVFATLAIAGLVPTVTASATQAPHPQLATRAASATTGLRLARSPATASSGVKPLWVGRFTGTEGHTAGFAVAVSPKGSAVFVTGQEGSGGHAVRSAGVTVAYNPATGAVLWQTRYEPAAPY